MIGRAHRRADAGRMELRHGWKRGANPGGKCEFGGVSPPKLLSASAVRARVPSATAEPLGVVDLDKSRRQDRPPSTGLSKSRSQERPTRIVAHSGAGNDTNDGEEHAASEVGEGRREQRCEFLELEFIIII